MTPDIREKARAIVLKWQTTTPSQLVDDIATAIQDERDAAIGECAKACGLCGGLGYDGMGGEEYECVACSPIRKLKRDAS